eukprot:c53643_g1_i1.p1 GENE.c53643_g1_i1~~c53643_g1_i1.p1  ORF type:complete len:262 (+),score=51.75 c53643_g1_i1:32-787(+)
MDEDELRAALQSLQDECRTLASQLINRPIDASTQGSALIAKEQSLLAALAHANLHPLNKTAIEPAAIVGLDLLARAEQSLEDYDSAITLLEQQIVQESAALESERRLAKERETLQEGLQSPSQPRRVVHSEEERIKRLATAFDKASQMTMLGMRNFLDTHYPSEGATPDFTTLPNQAKSHAKKKGQDEESLVPLRDLLQDLMNASVMKPNDPYVRLTNQHWTPHVELLLSSHIAEKHHLHGNQIKLTDFVQ